MHPYRTPPVARIEDDTAEPAEESALIAAMIVLGGLRVLVAIAIGQPFDAEPTVALAMLVTGVAWAVRRLVRSR